MQNVIRLTPSVLVVGFVFGLVASQPGCGGSGSSSPDMSASTAADMTTPPLSCCGKPGSVAVNDLGIGAYCGQPTDCTGNTICSSLGNTATQVSYFCTIVLTNVDASAFSLCGPNAEVVCAAQGCACAPTSCVETLPKGCVL